MFVAILHFDSVAPNLRHPYRNSDFRADRAGLGGGYGLCRGQVDPIYGAVPAGEGGALNGGVVLATCPYFAGEFCGSAVEFIDPTGFKADSTPRYVYGASSSPTILGRDSRT